MFDDDTDSICEDDTDDNSNAPADSQWPTGVRCAIEGPVKDYLVDLRDKLSSDSDLI